MPCSLAIEIEFRAAGQRIIAGVDEAGRGPLAAPVMAAAVILPEDFAHPLLNDSKQLTHAQRESIYAELTGIPNLHFASALATVEEIDRINILRATHLAMERAVRNLALVPDLVLIDGLPVRNFPFPSHAIVKGDGLSLSIAAASVIAKVERDRMMSNYALEWPGYGFDSHKGYGTPQHLAELASRGPCPIHRMTFSPLSQPEFELSGEAD